MGGGLTGEAKKSTQSTPRFSRDTNLARPKSPDGGLRFPHTAAGLSSFKAVALGDALDPSESDPEKLTMKRHLNWGNASAHQLKRTLAGVGEVLRKREVRRAFDKAPRSPAAGTSSVSSFNEKLRAGLLFFLAMPLPL